MTPERSHGTIGSGSRGGGARAGRWDVLGARLGLPAGASVALHALLALGAALLVWDIAWRSPRAGPEVYITFDEVRRGGSGGPSPPASQPGTERNAVTPGASERPEPGAAPVLTGLASIVSDGAEPAPLSPTLAAARDGGPLVAGPPAGVDVKFAGLGASSARSVVYVVDGSGPMVSTLSEVTAEVQRSISRLGPSQRFGVVVFRKRQRVRRPEPGLTAPATVEELAPEPGAEGDDGSPGFEWFTPTLVRATPEAKRRVEQWLSGIKPTGRSTPLDGLRAAMGMRPDAIFLLSRSIERSGGGVWDLGLSRTMDELERLNPKDRASGRRPIIIKTIQFLDEDPTGIMQAIGRDHGGAGPGAAASAYTVLRRAKDLAAK